MTNFGNNSNRLLTTDNSGARADAPVHRGLVSVDDHAGMSLMYQMYSRGQYKIDNAGRVSYPRHLAPFPDEVNKVIQDSILRVGRRGTVLFADLLDAGLVVPLPGWLGVTEYTQRRMDFEVNAQRTMELDVRGERQMPDFNEFTVPIWATWADNSIGIREREKMKRGNINFDGTWVEAATYKINRNFEDQAWNGLTNKQGGLIKINGNTAPGVLTSPTNTFEFTGSNPSWTHASKKGSEILADVQGMAAMMEGEGDLNEFPGPYTLYVNTAYNNALNDNYSDGTTTFDMTIRQRLQMLEFGGAPLRIRPAYMLGADQVVMIQLTSDNIDVILGQQPSDFTWLQNNGLRQFYMVLGCAVVRVKTNYFGRSGIVVGGLPD